MQVFFYFFLPTRGATLKLADKFGDRLQRARMQNHPGLTMADMSRLTGISKGLIGVYEKRLNATKLEVQHIASLAQAYGISMEYLLLGRERATKINSEYLQFAIEKTESLIPKGAVAMKGKLIEFVYSLKAQGGDAKPEVINAFYATL